MKVGYRRMDENLHKTMMGLSEYLSHYNIRTSDTNTKKWVYKETWLNKYPKLNSMDVEYPIS
jgi:hypothetical protein